MPATGTTQVISPMSPPSAAGGHGRARSRPGVDAHETPAGGLWSRTPPAKAGESYHGSQRGSAPRGTSGVRSPVVRSTSSIAPSSPTSPKATTAAGSLGARATAVTGWSVNAGPNGASSGLSATRRRPSRSAYATRPSVPTPSTAEPTPNRSSLTAVPVRSRRYAESDGPLVNGAIGATKVASGSAWGV